MVIKATTILNKGGTIITCKVIAPGVVIGRVRTLLDGEQDEVRVAYIYALQPWDVVVHTQFENLQYKWHEWQIDAVDIILQQYRANEKASLMVCGPPGAGKSTLGVMLAQKMNTVDCLVVNLLNCLQFRTQPHHERTFD